MIGDAEILQARAPAPRRPSRRACAAVAGGGVVVKSAAQILQLDEIGQRVLFRRDKFPAILAQLRLDVIEPQRAVEYRAPRGSAGIGSGVFFAFSTGPSRYSFSVQPRASARWRMMMLCSFEPVK